MLCHEKAVISCCKSCFLPHHLPNRLDDHSTSLFLLYKVKQRQIKDELSDEGPAQQSGCMPALGDLFHYCRPHGMQPSTGSGNCWPSIRGAEVFGTGVCILSPPCLSSLHWDIIKIASFRSMPLLTLRIFPLMVAMVVLLAPQNIPMGVNQSWMGSIIAMPHFWRACSSLFFLRISLFSDSF